MNKFLKDLRVRQNMPKEWRKEIIKINLFLNEITSENFKIKYRTYKNVDVYLKEIRDNNVTNISFDKDASGNGSCKITFIENGYKYRENNLPFEYILSLEENLASIETIKYLVEDEIVSLNVIKESEDYMVLAPNKTNELIIFQNAETFNEQDEYDVHKDEKYELMRIEVNNSYYNKKQTRSKVVDLNKNTTEKAYIQKVVEEALDIIEDEEHTNVVNEEEDYIDKDEFEFICREHGCEKIDINIDNHCENDYIKVQGVDKILFPLDFASDKNKEDYKYFVVHNSEYVNKLKNVSICVEDKTGERYINYMEILTTKDEIYIFEHLGNHIDENDDIVQNIQITREDEKIDEFSKYNILSINISEFKRDEKEL